MEQVFLSEKNTDMLFDLFKTTVRQKLDIDLDSTKYYQILSDIMEDVTNLEYENLQDMNKDALAKTTTALLKEEYKNKQVANDKNQEDTDRNTNKNDTQIFGQFLGHPFSECSY